MLLNVQLQGSSQCILSLRYLQGTIRVQTETMLPERRLRGRYDRVERFPRRLEN